MKANERQAAIRKVLKSQLGKDTVVLVRRSELLVKRIAPTNDPESVESWTARIADVLAGQPVKVNGLMETSEDWGRCKGLVAVVWG
jgi:hypothetical protein